MNIYVYQLSDTDFGAGFVKDECEKRGRIVESWPINSVTDARYVEKHGSNYGNAGTKVARLADFAKRAIFADTSVTEGIVLTQAEWDMAIGERVSVVTKQYQSDIKAFIDAQSEDRTELLKAFEAKHDAELAVYRAGLKAANQAHEAQETLLSSQLASANAKLSELELTISDIRSAHAAKIAALSESAIEVEARTAKAIADAEGRMALAIRKAIDSTRSSIESYLSSNRLKSIFRLLRRKRIYDAVKSTD